MNDKTRGQKLPVILYEESMDGSWESSIPYIEIEDGEKMPKALFIQEYRFTGETEPDSFGNESPVYDAYMHMYLNMEDIKEALNPELYDTVRIALGLKPLKQAKKEGEKILSSVATEAEEKIIQSQKSKNTGKFDATILAKALKDLKKEKN